MLIKTRKTSFCVTKGGWWDPNSTEEYASGWDTKGCWFKPGWETTGRGTCTPAQAHPRLHHQGVEKPPPPNGGPEGPGVRALDTWSGTSHPSGPEGPRGMRGKCLKTCPPDSATQSLKRCPPDSATQSPINYLLL